MEQKNIWKEYMEREARVIQRAELHKQEPYYWGEHFNCNPKGSGDKCR